MDKNIEQNAVANIGSLPDSSSNQLDICHEDQNIDVENPSSCLESFSIPQSESNSLFQKRWGNQAVLIATTTTFALFVASLIVGALASGSLSLLGDAAAMSVDVCTYFSNMYAERVKSRSNDVIDHRTRILLEIAIPTFSLSALIAVTVYIFVKAVAVILSYENDQQAGNVDVSYLYGYSVANLFVDLFCGYMFYQAGRGILYHEDTCCREAIKTNVECDKCPDNDDLAQKKKNLNMISALIHVGGDSLRTISVFAAAVITTATSVSGTLTDAWAAIAVTASIVAIALPLVNEIVKAIYQLLL